MKMLEINSLTLTCKNLMVGLNRKSFFEGRFAQILIEADEFKASGRFLSPYEGCRKLQGVRGPQGMN